MKRRTFLYHCAAQSLALYSPFNLRGMGEKQNGENYGIHVASKTVVDTLAGMSLVEFRDFHVNEVNNGYLPAWNGLRIDREYGGFLPQLNDDGTRKSTDKEMYYQGRGVWIFSYIYNHFGGNERHFEIARKGKEFIVKHHLNNNYCWNSKVTRDGKLIQGSYNIYGDIYAVLALGEYLKATGEKDALDLAIKTAYSIMERIVSPAYQHLNGYGQDHEPGTKRLGTWQHFLSALTPLARISGEHGIEMIAKMCVRNIMERHWQPESGVFLEHLDDQFQPFRIDPFDNHRAVSGWHSIQACWMCMDEALRIGHSQLFLDAMEKGRMVLEKCWIEDCGLADRKDPGANPAPPAEGRCRWSVLDDVLVFTLLSIEHTHAPWAIAWLEKVWAFMQKYPNRLERQDLLHHPRRLFFATDILNHMISRNGRISDFLNI